MASASVPPGAVYSTAAVPIFFAAGTSFMEDNFSTDVVVGGVVWGLFKHVTRIVYIISIIITSTPPRAIRYQIPEVEDYCYRGQSALWREARLR